MSKKYKRSREEEARGHRKEADKFEKKTIRKMNQKKFAEVEKIGLADEIAGNPYKMATSYQSLWSFQQSHVSSLYHQSVFFLLT